MLFKRPRRHTSLGVHGTRSSHDVTHRSVLHPEEWRSQTLLLRLSDIKSCGEMLLSGGRRSQQSSVGLPVCDDT